MSAPPDAVAPVVSRTLSRRRFLGSAGAAAAGLWLAQSGLARAAAPPGPGGFPGGIDVYRETYENWSGEIHVPNVWTCAPRSASDVVAVANWAVRNGFRVRPRGMRHNWSPLTIPAGADTERVLLVDTTRFLNRVEVRSRGAVAVQTGATIAVLLQAMRDEGLGFMSVPSTGEITVGGVLAVGGHGSSLPARGESGGPSRSYGSLSNRVASLRAVVWDRRGGRFVLRRFERTDPDVGPFLAHLGRAFLTDVTLQGEPHRNVRCESLVDVPARELMGMPGSGGRTYASLVEPSGQAEVIWYAFTDNPWVKVWTPEATRPASSREVTGPYNYPFSDNLPAELASLADRMVTTSAWLTPAFGRSMYAATVAGLEAYRALDLWGASKDVFMYVRPTTIRVSEFGIAVLTRRRDLQRVIAEFSSEYARRLEAEARQGRYPVSVGLQFRSTGLDQPEYSGVDGARPPTLSALAPRAERPEWDTAVWFNLLSFPDTAGADAFKAGLERWAVRHFAGSFATVRPEWSKGWAFTSRGAWSDGAAMSRRIPASFEGWDDAVATLERYDPHRVFSNSLLDVLARTRSGSTRG
jgi:FAD/FMN-containing dehydrogenase